MINKDSVLIHIPHSSLYIPKSEREKILLTEAELQEELLIMTDRYTDELFDIGSYDRHMDTVSRLVMDPERFRLDEDEEMASVGMGAIYSKTSDGKTLRNISVDEKNAMLLKYYDPYHKAFTEKVQQKLTLYGNCIIIDAHSFPSKPLPYEKDKSVFRPNICIGYEDFNNVPGHPRLAGEFFFLGKNMTVSYNEPFVGSIVPECFYKKDKRVTSLMIELNRSIYMDEKTGRKTKRFDEVKNMLKEFMEYMVSVG